MFQELQKEFPKVFPNPIYIDINPGWKNLIKNLCQELEEYLIVHSIKDFETSCVKTKFGGLRFHSNSTDEDLNFIINQYENLSYEFCEECGNPASRKTINNWIWTLCEKCYEERI